MPPVVDQLPLGPLATNCYLVRADRAASEAVVVDPSGTAAEIRLELASRAARCVAILVTHSHFDHVLGLADLAEETGAPVHAPAGELAVLEDPTSYAPAGLPLRACTPDVLLEGGETLELAGVMFDVVPVPGHSPAHVAYAIEGAVLSGDVLFAGSIGRTDLAGGSDADMRRSLREKVWPLDDATLVLPGHGPATTIRRERATNPYLRDAAEVSA